MHINFNFITFATEIFSFFHFVMLKSTSYN
nr:MAG TPA: hypothetical protein [Caudoviricetes sp.]